MAHTVVGIFEDADAAKNARQELLNNGFSAEDVDIARGDSFYDRDHDHDHEHEHENGIQRFFRNLFGRDDETERYSRVAKRGCVVTVHTESKQAAERAADFLDDRGAVDVDEHYSRYHDENDDSWGTETAAAAGAGTGLGVGTPMGDTYVDTEQTTSGIVRDHNIDGTRHDLDESGSIFENDRERNRRRDDIDRVRDRDTMDEEPYDATDQEGIAAPGDVDMERNTRRDDFDYAENNRRDDNERTIPVIEENLRIDKKEVETGGVRIRSRIIEKPVERHLRLREEHIKVERRPVDREATPEELENLRDETFEMTERKEVPAVSKEARVSEEVSLHKTVDHRDETVADTERKNEVDTEEFDTDHNRRDKDLL